MSTLHIISSSPVTTEAFDLALSLALEGDAILLTENGVYGAADAPGNVQRLASAPPGLQYYALQEDMSARALSGPLAPFQAVSYADFVGLVCQHNNSVSWS